MIGEELSTLTAILKSYRGEVILTVARDKARETKQFREKVCSFCCLSQVFKPSST